MTIPFELKSVN